MRRRFLRPIALIAFLVGAAAFAATPSPASACTGFFTPFAKAVPHAAAIYIGTVVGSTQSANGVNTIRVRVGAVIKGTPRTTITPIANGPFVCNAINVGDTGVVLLASPSELGTPTEFGFHRFYKIGHPYGTARVLVDEALRANDLPDTATAPPGTDDPYRRHPDAGAWPMVILIVGLFAFMLVLRLSRPRRRRDDPGTLTGDARRQGRTSSAARTRAGEPPAVTTSPPSA